MTSLIEAWEGEARVCAMRWRVGVRDETAGDPLFLLLAGFLKATEVVSDPDWSRYLHRDSMLADKLCRRLPPADLTVLAAHARGDAAEKLAKNMRADRHQDALMALTKNPDSKVRALARGELGIKGTVSMEPRAIILRSRKLHGDMGNAIQANPETLDDPELRQLTLKCIVEQCPSLQSVHAVANRFPFREIAQQAPMDSAWAKALAFLQLHAPHLADEPYDAILRRLPDSGDDWVGTPLQDEAAALWPSCVFASLRHGSFSKGDLARAGPRLRAAMLRSLAENQHRIVYQAAELIGVDADEVAHLPPTDHRIICQALAALAESGGPGARAGAGA